VWHPTVFTHNRDGSWKRMWRTSSWRRVGLNEQPVAAQSGLRFLCLTDDPNVRSESWEMRLVSPVFGMDPIRSQRDLKIRPHVYLPEFNASLYIDNSILLSEPPERLFNLFERARGFCIPTHSYRDTVLDEFLEVAKHGLDDQSRIFEQLNHYLIDYPEVLRESPTGPPSCCAITTDQWFARP
jgi:hypothetical protein